MVTIINMNKSISDFTRNEMIVYLEKLIRSQRTREDLRNIWSTCIEFNENHPGEEIFLSDNWDDGTIFLEDDMFPLHEF